jgi:hypothetical protein
MEHECGAVMACAVSAAVGEAGKNRHYSFAPFGWPLSTYWADLRMQVWGNSAQNRQQAGVTGLGRTSPFRGEGGNDR